MIKYIQYIITKEIIKIDTDLVGTDFDQSFDYCWIFGNFNLVDECAQSNIVFVGSVLVW